MWLFSINHGHQREATEGQKKCPKSIADYKIHNVFLNYGGNLIFGNPYIHLIRAENWHMKVTYSKRWQ